MTKSILSSAKTDFFTERIRPVTGKKVLQLLAIVTFLLSCVYSFFPARAATLTTLDIIDTSIEALMNKHGLPGVAIAVVQGDEIIHLKGFGTAGTHAMTPQTQMFIGSQSKSFTALLIAQLAERGELDLNATVQTYLPWFEIADKSASKSITIKHLLGHTSGLSDAGYSVVLPFNATPEQAARSLAQAHLTAPTGTQFQYFNLGYDVLTCIIETITGEPYSQVLREEVLEPLGMFRTTAEPAEAADLSWGYTRLFGFALPMRQPVRDYEIGAGYIISTAEDMARYAIAMKNLDSGLLSPETARMIFTPGLGDYGMGWHIVDGGSKIFHGGANETFATHVNIYPDRDLAFVLLINEGYQVDHFISSQQLAQTVEAILLGNSIPPVSQGWSVHWIGWALGVVVLALCWLHTHNLIHLKGWRKRVQNLPAAKIILDVAISFLIPSIILLIIFSQVKTFYGYRFNFLPTLIYMRLGLPDVFILMLVGTLPDYIQGLIKLGLALSDKR